jgi:hypothetical protein
MSATHICKARDIDDSPQNMPRRRSKFTMKIRDAVLTAPEFVVMATEHADWTKKAIDELGIYCRYASTRPSRGIRRTPMNINEMSEKWETLIVGLATAHDKIERDKWEHDIDDYLMPILSAPVKQLREFFTLLVKRLKENKSVPFFVWRSLEVWQEQIVKSAPDQEVKELKIALARQIADLVEEDVKRDIGEAVVGALMWRDQKTLKEIKKTLVDSKKEGEPATVSTKTRAVGRQSCLFLVVEHKGQEQTVML